MLHMLSRLVEVVATVVGRLRGRIWVIRPPPLPSFQQAMLTGVQAMCSRQNLLWVLLLLLWVLLLLLWVLLLLLLLLLHILGALGMLGARGVLDCGKRIVRNGSCFAPVPVIHVQEHVLSYILREISPLEPALGG